MRGVSKAVSGLVSVLVTTSSIVAAYRGIICCFNISIYVGY